MPYKNKADQLAAARRGYRRHAAVRIAAVVSYRAANPEKARLWNRNWWHGVKSKKPRKATAEELLARAAALAAKALADRARGYAGVLNPGRI